MEADPSGAGAESETDPRTADPIELGIELLETIETDELPLASAVDRIETITTDPRLTRAILDAAAERGLLDRDAGVVRPVRGRFIRFDRQVVRIEGDFECRRCGASLSTGHFIEYSAGRLGPFGSTCIRYVTGRESE